MSYRAYESSLKVFDILEPERLTQQRANILVKSTGGFQSMLGSAGFPRLELPAVTGNRAWESLYLCLAQGGLIFLHCTAALSLLFYVGIT